MLLKSGSLKVSPAPLAIVERKTKLKLLGVTFEDDPVKNWDSHIDHVLAALVKNGAEYYTSRKKKVTWLTIVVNDEFAIPALVLGDSIQTFSCQRNMIALISDTLSMGTQRALQKVGWDTRIVEALDCDWLETKLGVTDYGGLFGRAQNHGIKGTHTRFHAWNYTEFSKIIYVDADYMLMTNIDQLFVAPGDFAAAPCSRPGVVDPCFNADLMVFRPDVQHHQDILNLWWNMTRQGTCPNDQVLYYGIITLTQTTGNRFLTHSTSDASSIGP
ncbi:Glycogenin-1 [Stylophora pistillata]|uniref:Glycogenin-1 n=1 Tax=Stylophora pistillata TaxID=50429 RepID=A0A2B4SQG8_STYPI|nr:Glycogenin-1 [Stylophora pistillata]